ncbi:[FeFe] hydrogenase H-cluster radical SAM maturase HydE [Peptoclostridium sp. AF21-18]|uniref:[FeFe] hydrogenase H-cluster radical SAM maturase HydE n=1 Tax=Peptoclostridium sp. AF21-18 TaxID=2292243 RepID=UPI000E4FEF26|nr:[FeFe] hydrogenase H-cluster radical SAM maturase HydE [Peptoclostridium sp. AF21-18]RHQ98544.1 [FeFe] hydrogenase H-cluster radical SAM maturase HydE [Peptoclostridium sp. AF21-18]
MKNLIDKLEKNQILSKEEFVRLLAISEKDDIDYLTERAKCIRDDIYGKRVFIRGLIEISNYCKNDCYYCGIRRSNKNAQRYRLSKEQILSCCENGYELGFRTFVMQGGEDAFFKDEVVCDIVSSIKERYPDCAVTLSLGERSTESYRKMKEAGADRYLLRHETFDNTHYNKLHSVELDPENRKRCLRDLKALGYQTGTGIMVGSPYQTLENIAEDLLFIKELNPEMIGIGPFIPHKDTPFKNFESGTMEMTLRLISILRLLCPKALIPATTALGTISPQGREKGILAGANVIMPNLSPKEDRKKYMLYNDKLSDGEEAAEGLNKLKESMRKIGYEIVEDRGDCIALKDKI